MEVIFKKTNCLDNILQEASRATYKTKRASEPQGSHTQKTKANTKLRTECIKSQQHTEHLHQCNQTCLGGIHGYIGITLSEGNYQSAGTGVLICANLVLTAARNICTSQNTKISNAKLEFTLEQCGPFKVIDSYIPESYFKTQQDDYALLVLEKFIGEDVGYAGLQAVAGNGMLQTKELLFSEDNGDFRICHQNTLLVTNYGTGNGIFVHDNNYNKDYVVGIQLTGFEKLNDAIWITIERFNQITEWMMRVKQKITAQQNAAEIELVTLNLAGRNIGDEGALALSKYHDGNLGRLVLSANKIGERGAVAIGMDVSWTNLELLVLDDNFIGDFGAAEIANNVSWRNLKLLYLSNNNIGDSGAAAIERNSAWVSLQVLRMSNNALGDDGAEALSRNETWKSLRLLDLSRNRISDTGALMLGYNSSWTELETLNLGHNQISNDGAAGLAKNTSWGKLQELSLVENQITDGGAKAITLNKTWKNLQRLFLQGNRLTDATTIAHELNVEFSKELIENPEEEINMYRMDSLFDSIMRSMIEDKYKDERREKLKYIFEKRQTLKLNGGNLQIEGININENAHLHWCPSLKSLDLSGFVLSDSGMLGILQNRTWSRLEEINLSRTQLSDRTACIFAKNESWTHLLSLDLSINRISNEGAVALANNTVWKHLTTLNLMENKIEDEGVIAIARNKTWVNLESLSLRKNRIGDKGAIELARNDVWVRLKVLNLADNSIGNEGAASLMRNYSWVHLSELSLVRNPISIEESWLTSTNLIRKNLKSLDMCDDDQEKLSGHATRGIMNQQLNCKTRDEQIIPEGRKQFASVLLGTQSYH